MNAVQQIFMNGAPSLDGYAIPSTPIYRGDSGVSQAILDQIESINRGDFGGDISKLQAEFAKTMADLTRAISVSGTSGLPIREDLEAPARLLVPIETPVRNYLPRIQGAGSAHAWRQMTSTGGGYNISTTVTSGASSATQTVGSTVGMQAGDSLYFATTNAYRIVSSVTDATTVVLTATISTTTSEVVTFGPYRQGPAAAATRAFFAESGAPADHATTYVSKSSSYKLLGSYFSVTGLAMAAGASFQNQLATEKLNAIRTVMLNEENALINGSSTATAAPWGDGSTALGFDGLRNLIATANGTPADQVQTSVGALTFSHIDAQLSRLWAQGGEDFYMVMNGQEVQSLKHLAEASGSVYRVIIANQGDATIGTAVQGYIHPVTGQVVKVLASRFCPAGTILYGCGRLPDGSPAAQVAVLPQVQLRQLAPTDMVQGYVAQELAPTTSAPQVYPGIVTVFETLMMKSALHFAKSTGVTAV